MLNKNKHLKNNNMVSYMTLPGLKTNTVIPNMQRQHPAYIEDFICKFFDVPIAKVKSKSRKREFCFARQVIMFFLRRYTELPLKSIGGRFGRDHTTAIHSIATINNLMETDAIIRSQIRHIESTIQ